MRKLYVAITAFAALVISQIGHAIPVIPGATDIASNDGETYYALVERDGGWHVDGYNADGTSNSFTMILNGGVSVTPENQRFVGLAFDGSTFYGLRNDLESKKGTDTWTVAGFNLSDGMWDGSATVLNGGVSVIPSLQAYVGLGVAEEGFFGLRDDSLSRKGTDTWTNVGFELNGAWSGQAEVLGASPSTTPYTVQLSYNLSPAQSFQSTNVATAGVPEAGTGLLLGSLFALGLMRRRKSQAA